MTKWTKEQQQAIVGEGTNIIVSAGAGSGKTAVLTARVLRKIQQGIDIDKLLILTFTNAAAKEMKERIRNNIINDNNLENQLEKLDEAYITTFDSFSLSLVKKYHYLLNISKNISVIDDSIIKVKKREIIDYIFEDLYKKEDKDFLNLIGTFYIKEDKDIKKHIINIDNKISMIYDNSTYLKDYLDINFNNQKIEKDISKYISLIKEKIAEVKNLSEYILANTEGKFFEDFSIQIQPLLESMDYAQIKATIEIKLPRLPNGTQTIIKTKKDIVTKLITQIKELVEYDSLEQLKEIIMSTYSYTKVIIDIIVKLTEKLDEYKNINDSYEFIDISKMAIKIVKENKKISDELKKYYNEIMVDEYQDTNDLQEIFINQIENNNIYMVGDIKQSIYRFRNANPDIFKVKYDLYAKTSQGLKIDLNKNFRSRMEVLDNINEIFNLVMDNNIGGAEYQVSHNMIFGNDTYNQESLNDSSNIDVLTYDYTKYKNLYSKEEIEIFSIVNDIENKIKDQFKVLDKKTNKLRLAQYQDFVILIDRATNFELYKKIFESKKIPLTIFKDENITNTTDLLLFNNILKLITQINKKTVDTNYKYYFTSIARSYLFSYSDQQIVEVINSNSFFDTDIIKKLTTIANDIESLSISEILKQVLEQCDFYNNIIKVGDIKNALTRIEYLIKLAKQLEDLGYTILDFANHLDNIIENELPIRYSINNDSKDSVRIMTIHKSKGLEFPICYFSGLSSKFNISDLKERFLFDNALGIITPYFKDGIGETIYKTMLKESYIKDEVSERIRLFYVALTRTKEKIILIVPTFKEHDEITNLVEDYTRINYKSFYEILNSINYNLLKYTKEIDLEKLDLNKEYNIIKKTNYKDKIEPFTEELVIKETNYHVEYIEEKTYSKKIKEIISKEEYNNIELGLQLHEILEYIDFKNPDYTGVEDKYIQNVKYLVENDLFKTAINFYKEYEFIIQNSEDKQHGIIDLVVEYSDYYAIIDYKLLNIEDPGYIKQLNGYKDFLKTITKKEVKIFLYSIITKTLKELK